jgi:hypothetical protein
MLHSLTTIRAATVADADALAGLADASHTRRLHGRVLIAEGDQRPIAAIEVASGAVIADRSSSTAAVQAVTLLRRHRYLVLRQAGGGAQTRSLFRREAARLAA